VRSTILQLRGVDTMQELIDRQMRTMQAEGHNPKA
jgi:HPr kinase/phosphorylase